MEDIDPKKIREEAARQRETEDVRIRLMPENEAAAYYAGQSQGYRQAVTDLAVLVGSAVAGFLLVAILFGNVKD